VYGENMPSTPISVSLRDFISVFGQTGASTLLTLKIPTEKVGDTQDRTVLIYGVNRDPVRGTPLHADFFAVQMNKAIQTDVPLVFIGDAPAVKNLGAVLVRPMQSVEIEALPKDLPHELEVDISTLDEIDAKILIRDIPTPNGVTILTDSEEVVALAAAQMAEEEPDVTPAEPADVQTEREARAAEKEKEGDAEKEAAE
jgi:large subunit ribosomal protein L25